MTLMVTTGFALVMGGAHVWAARTLAQTEKGGLAHTVAEMVTLI